MPTVFRAGDLLTRLDQANVSHIVVGGLAVGAWGYVRATRDLDIVPAPDDANLERLAAALTDLQGKVKAGSSYLASSAISTFLRAGDKTLVATEIGEVDVLQGLPQVPRYEHLARTAETAAVAGLDVQVCSLKDLLAMKRAADRPIDRIDVEALLVANPGAESSSG